MSDSLERVVINSESYNLLRELCEENGETIQECVERLIDKENFDRHYTYDGLSGKTYQHTCLSNKCIMRSPRRKV
jgi:hypothetical protein